MRRNRCDHQGSRLGNIRWTGSVCGADVGFGKDGSGAASASFQPINDKQVAVVVPTPARRSVFQTHFQSASADSELMSRRRRVWCRLQN